MARDRAASVAPLLAGNEAAGAEQRSGCACARPRKDSSAPAPRHGTTSRRPSGRLGGTQLTTSLSSTASVRLRAGSEAYAASALSNQTTMAGDRAPLTIASSMAVIATLWATLQVVAEKYSVSGTTVAAVRSVMSRLTVTSLVCGGGGGGGAGAGGHAYMAIKNAQRWLQTTLQGWIHAELPHPKETQRFFNSIRASRSRS